MAVTNQDITLYQGDVVPILFQITDDADAAIDISAATFIWGLFKVPTEIATVTKAVGTGLTVTDGPAGKVTLQMLAPDTNAIQGDWQFELSMTLGGVTEIVATGTMTILNSSVQ